MNIAFGEGIVSAMNAIFLLLEQPGFVHGMNPLFRDPYTTTKRGAFFKNVVSDIVIKK